MAAANHKSPNGTRLTGRGAGLLLLSLAVTVAGAVIPEPNAVRLGLLGMLLLPLTWPLARRNLKALRVERRIPESCFAGQLFSMDLTLVNDKPRMDSMAVELEDGIAGPAERGLTARWVRNRGGRVVRTLTTRLLRRGVNHRLRSMLTSTFPLGLWKSRQELRETVDVIVYPRPVTPRALEEATDAAMIDTDEAESSHRDWMGDFHGVRAFQPGDRLKLIHWPSTARSGGALMVRQFDRPLPEKYFVLFHSIPPERNTGDRGDGFESAMELLCGMIMYCRDHSIPMELAASFDDWRSIPVATPVQIEDALYLLAAARRNGERDPNNMVRALSGVDRHTRVFILSDVPVKDWEPMLPDFPFAITCLSVSDLRIKRPGLSFRSTKDNA
ncbi:MAG TPA: DUF58 domain-containing protein [Verrucomicrobiales bacterium]|nr:DUF58 domain-containing protein [Verrucomicrobiales bacterium]